MSEIKIDQDLDGTFIRGTSAEQKDGTIVSNSSPKYEDAVPSITVDTPAEWDRGTYTRLSGISYNLLTANQSNVETDTTGFTTSGGAVITRDTTWSWQGTASLKITNASTSAIYGALNGINVTNGKSYIYSAYIYNPNSSMITVTMNVVYGTSLTNIVSIPASGVVRVSHSRSATATSTNNTVRFYEATAQPFHVDGLMMEEATGIGFTSPSPWVVGQGYGLALKGMPTFIRISNAYDVGINVGSGTPRYVSGGILIESASTNIFQRSEEFDDVYWTKTGVSVTADSSTCPNGAVVADKIVEDSASSFHLVAKPVSVTAGAYYANSVYAKAGERNWFRINVGTAAGLAYCNFNLANGTIGNNSNCINKQIVYVGDGWYRCTISSLATSTATSPTQFAIMDSDSSNSSSAGVNYTGDGTSGIYIWGAQAEAFNIGSTSYIPTTTASVTRNADNIVMGNNILNTGSGAVVMRVYVSNSKNSFAYSGTNIKSLFRFLTQNATSLLALDYVMASSSPLRVAAVDVTGTSVITSPTGFVTEGWYNIGVRWSSTSYELWIDGTKLSTVATPAAAMAPWTQLCFGCRANSSTSVTQWDDLIDYIALYDDAPSTGQMAYFTTIGPTGAVYQIDFTASTGNITFSASGIYTSEWFNSGASGCVYTASGTVITPTGTSVFREYRTSNSDTQANPSVWSTTIGTGKYIQFRENLFCDQTATLKPIVNSTTIMPAQTFGRAVRFENGTTNMFTTPNSPVTQELVVLAGDHHVLRFEGNALSSGNVQIDNKLVLTSTADFSAGTLTNATSASNQLTLSTAKADPALTRATVAYLPDELTQVSSGTARYASGWIGDGATNLIAYSEAFDNSSHWTTSNNVTVVPNAAIAPNGLKVACKLVPNTLSTTHGISKSAIFTQGNPAILSVYAKAGEYSWLNLGPSQTTESAQFDLSAGTVLSVTGAGGSGIIMAIGNGWYRCTWSTSAVITNTTSAIIRSTAVSGTVGAAGDGTSGIYIWGAQAELTNNLSTYIPTIGASATRFAGSNDRAILIEEATTNLTLRSQEFDDAYWTKTRCTVTANATTAPDGTNTADKLISDATASDTHYISRDPIFTVSSSGTISIYAKAAEYNWVCLNPQSGGAWFDLSSGATGLNNISGWTSEITSIGNGWYRCSISTASVASTSFDAVQIYIANADATTTFSGDGTSGIYIWGVQAEIKAFPTTYVATTSATVTRDVENISISSTNIFSNINSGGSFIARFKMNSSNTTNIKMIADIGGTSASGCWVGINSTTGFAKFSYGSTSLNGSVAVSANVWHTIGCAWGPNGGRLYLDGVQIASGAVAAAIVESASYRVGTNSGTIRALNGLCSDWVLYREELLDSELSLYTSTGAIIPLDHRTAYLLRFEDNLLHGEGGVRIGTSKALDDAQSISRSSVMWSETEAATAAENFVWVNGENVTITGNTVQKTAGVDGSYDAQAVSRKLFQKGDNFYCQFVPGNVSTGKNKVFGIQNDPNSTSSYTDMDFAVAIIGSSATAYENGASVSTLKSSGGTASDIYRIDVIDDVVRYYVNGVLTYTSTAIPAYPLLASVSIRNTNEYVSGCVFGYYPKVDVDVSIDNGVTWSPIAAQSGSIAGLTSPVTAIGKTFVARQKLTTPRSAISPSLNDITYFITQDQTKNIHEYIKPLWTTLKFTPVNVTKWQLENRSYSTSYQNDGTTRNSDLMMFPTSGVIFPSSGAVILRFYWDEAHNSAYATTVNNTWLFATSPSSGSINNLIGISHVSGNFRANWYNGSTSQIVSKSSSGYKTGWHTIGMTWASGTVSLWLDGALEGRTSGFIAPSVFNTIAYIGTSYAQTLRYNQPISQFDAFNEAPSDSEMTYYTAATGTVIPVSEKHSYQLKFENSITYGTAGLFTSRWIDGGSNSVGTPWVTYTATETKPIGTNIRYFFKASDTQSDSVTFTEDITAQTGRYMKVKAALITDDANAGTPSLQGLRIYPQNA